MPFSSEAQRRYLWAKHPEVAKEFAAATPKGKKLPEHVKTSFDLGTADALERFGFKQAAEELRLKIPSRTFHGYDAAHKGEAENAGKKANEASADDLAKLLGQIKAPISPTAEIAAKDRLDRSTAWGSPSNLAAGDTASRLSDMGQNTNFGGI
jgi:methylmalonyl-CoA mutase N-terminal domain/subunit